jgi:hypothetical protein
MIVQRREPQISATHQAVRGTAGALAFVGLGIANRGNLRAHEHSIVGNCLLNYN